MVNKHKHKKKKTLENYGKSNKELNALIEKKFQKFEKTIRGGKQRRSFSTFKKCIFWMIKTRKVSPALQEAWKAKKSQSPVLNVK